MNDKSRLVADRLLDLGTSVTETMHTAWTTKCIWAAFIYFILFFSFSCEIDQYLITFLVFFCFFLSTVIFKWFRYTEWFHVHVQVFLFNFATIVVYPFFSMKAFCSFVLHVWCPNVALKIVLFLYCTVLYRKLILWMHWWTCSSCYVVWLRIF